MQFQTKYFMESISTTLSGEILHARLFLLVSCGTLGRCQESRLKITALCTDMNRVNVRQVYQQQKC